MMAGILRCVLILLAGPNGAEQAGSWAVRETFVAVVVSNMPIIYSLLRSVFKSISEYTITISKRSTVNSSSHVRLDDINDSRDRHRRAGHSRDVYPVTSSSFEHIIQEEDLEGKSYGHQHLHSQGSPAQIGTLPRTERGGPGAGSRSPRITVATRTTVSSEAAPEALYKGTSGTDGLYQCRVSIGGNSTPIKR